jgi:Outer membrane protein beta-barrel domain
MKRFTKVIGALVAVAAFGASTAAVAADSFGLYNPAGLYFGGGVGESTIRSDDSAYGTPAYYNDHETAWKAIIGVRPISFVGAEVEYIDFGQPSHHYSYYQDVNYYGYDSHPTAPVLFGVGYLPIPIPFIDIFAKAGVARLRLNIDDYVAPTCAAGQTCPDYVLEGRKSVTATKFAYGGGISSKLPLGFTVRAEYERIASPYGDPDAFTVSALWTF